MTSCGSGPEGTRPLTSRVVASTTARVLSPLFRTRRLAAFAIPVTVNAAPSSAVVIALMCSVSAKCASSSPASYTSLNVKTAAIAYRVSDFLKQHPPFNCMDESDLLALASRGRVKFHEVDEFVCWQKGAYAALVFVIQQGAVSLWEEVQGKEILRDVRGPGDMI